MQKILIATYNKGKLNEIKHFLSDLPLEVVSLSDVDIKEDVEENGKTYKENSQKKALFFAKLSNLPAISDDGGIEIDALFGAPGIKSRRYFGKNGQEATDKEIIKNMMNLSKTINKDNNGARFITVVSFALPNKKVWSVTGEVKGIITQKPQLKLVTGYPYRSFFYLPQLKKYYHESELTPDEQKIYNHRYKAIQKLKTIIGEVLSI